MEAPQTDAQRVEWLWKRRDEDNARIVNLEAQNTVLSDDLKAARAALREAKYRERDLLEQIQSLGVAVNEANARAAGAVEEYRRNVGSG